MLTSCHHTQPCSQSYCCPRWTFQGLARNELEGVNFYPAGCVAQGMPGATADEIHKVGRHAPLKTLTAKALP